MIDHRMPLFFKLWFGFIACIVVTIFAAVFYFTFAAVSAGPEGLGKAIGSVIKGIDEGRK